MASVTGIDQGGAELSHEAQGLISTQRGVCVCDTQVLLYNTCFTHL